MSSSFYIGLYSLFTRTFTGCISGVEFQVVDLEFALTYEKISSDCCMLKIWDLASKAYNFSYKY